jgi:hypothetical protein
MLTERTVGDNIIFSQTMECVDPLGLWSDREGGEENPWKNGVWCCYA